MESSMRSRIDGTDKATASVHMDFGDDEMGYMVYVFRRMAVQNGFGLQ